MKIKPEKAQAIMALPGPKRYSHFIKVSADQRRVWGLFNDGWALYRVGDGKAAFPVWPAKEYALACATTKWKDFTPREIDLDTFLTVLLPKLRESRDSLTVFPTPDQKGVLPELETLERDLNDELGRVE